MRLRLLGALISAALFYLFLIFTPLQNARAGVDPEVAAEQTVKTLNEVIAKINSAPHPGVETCSIAGQKCDFDQLCQSLRPNRNSSEIYRNSQGQILPNISLLNFKHIAGSCRNKIDDALTDKINDRSRDADEKAEAKRRVENNKLDVQNQLKYLQSVERHHEEIAAEKFKIASLEVILEPTAPNLADPVEPENLSPREKLKSRITKYELRAGVHLSDESRERYLDWFTDAPELPGTPEREHLTDADQNPFSNTNVLFDVRKAGSENQVKKNQETYLKRLARVSDLFADTKSHVIEILISKRTTENAAEINNMIERVSKITLANVPSFNPQNLPGECGSLNAFFANWKHSFTLCPNILQMPDAALQDMIAHEIGHSIDPCRVTAPLNQVSGDEIVAFVPGYDPSRMPSKMILPFQPKKDGADSVQYISENQSDAEAYLKTHYVNGKLSQIQPGVPANRNPLAKTISCLSSVSSVHARYGSVKTAIALIDQQIAEIQRSGGGEGSNWLQTLKVSRENLVKKGDDFKSCNFMPAGGGRSQIQEAFGDWIASKVTKNKVAEAALISPEKARQVAFESMGIRLINDCQNLHPDAEINIREALLGTHCFEYQGEFSKLADSVGEDPAADSHPQTSNRVNNMLLREPEIQTALQCAADPEVKNCD